MKSSGKAVFGRSRWRLSPVFFSYIAVAGLVYIACKRSTLMCSPDDVGNSLSKYSSDGAGIGGAMNSTSGTQLFAGRSAADLKRKDDLLAHWPKDKPKGAYFVLARNSDLQGVIQSMGDLEARFNYKGQYPYIFVNDVDFDDNFIQEVEARTRAPVLFGRVPLDHWAFPDNVDRKEAEAAWQRMGQAGVLYGTSESYRHMCRYFSGFFMFHPLLDGFEYYWRVEPDIRFHCSLQADPFITMQERGASYGWNIILKEIMETIPTLWPSTIQFLHTAPSLMAVNNGIKAFSKHFKMGNTPTETLALSRYNGCHFWSNFEIGRLDFLRGHAYQSYFQFLDAKKGFYMERWGDAPVHSIAAMLFLNRTQIHQFDDIGYTHDFSTHCPQDPALAQYCSCQPQVDINVRERCMTQLRNSEQEEVS